MYSTYKKILAWLLVGVVLLGAVGCSGNGETQSETEGGEPTVEVSGEDTTEIKQTEDTDGKSADTDGKETGDTDGKQTEAGEIDETEKVASGRSLLIDVAKQASERALTQELVQKEMNAYAEMGYESIYFIPTADTYAVTESCQGSVLCDPEVETDQMHKSVHATLAPTLAYLLACKNAGMKSVVLYRPYETGGSVTVPTGISPQFSFGEMASLGGTAVFCSSEFAGLKSHHIRSLGNASGQTSKASVSRIEILFAAESFENGVAEGKTESYDPSASLTIVPKLWISDGKNINYRAFDGFSYTVKTETRKLTDSVGNSLGEKLCYVVEIKLTKASGETCFAVSFENGDQLYTVPFSMINAYDASGKAVSTTKTVYARNPYSDDFLGCESVPTDYFWGSERKPILTTSAVAMDAFRAFGFEYQYGGIGSDFGDGWHNAFVYGIAVGEQDFLHGNLDESKADVREYWLGQVDRFYAKGADAVIISLENHGGMVYNYTEYGYQAEYISALKSRYGIDALNDDFDYLLLMSLRGERFMKFLEGVALLAEARGKAWGVELVEAFTDPALDDDINGLCHYKMPKILYDWQTAVDACDIVLIKDRISGAYNAEMAKVIRSYADQADKQVAVMAYGECGADEDFVADALKDALNDVVVADFVNNDR